MTAWTDNYAVVDGIRTHYLEAGDGPPVVLLHGGEFGGSSELSWERNIGALAERYRVVAADWLGFGLTDKLHDFVGGAQRRLQHMARFLEVAGVGPAAFIGNSMGGALLARSIGSDAPAFDARALVIVSAGGFAPDNQHRRALLEYDCTVEGMQRILRVLFHDPAYAEDEEYVARRHASSIVPGAWECAAAARLQSPLVPPRADFGVPDPTAWEAITQPTLIVAGADDVLKEPGYADELVRRLPDPRSRAIVYEHCAHAPNIEVAERFNADVLAFLAEVYAPASVSVGAG
jgi:pimeloyl-ACP methyl ester carboxylesterase